MEQLVFLARSRHRLDLLRELSGGERSRRELEDSTEMSQPTLSRILSDLERRQWVSNEYDGTYTLTPLGTMLVGAVENVLTVLESSNQLAAVTDTLPLDGVDFDLRHLASATVNVPTEADPLSHMRRFDELVSNADTARVFSNVIACSPASGNSGSHREFLGEIDEIVVTETGLTGLNDPSLRQWVRERVDAGELEVYRYDGSASFLLGCFDEVVGIVPIDEAGMPTGLIETSDPTIHEWAQETFEELRRDATQFTGENSSDS